MPTFIGSTTLRLHLFGSLFILTTHHVVPVGRPITLQHTDLIWFLYIHSVYCTHTALPTGRGYVVRPQVLRFVTHGCTQHTTFRLFWFTAHILHLPSSRYCILRTVRCRFGSAVAVCARDTPHTTPHVGFILVHGPLPATLGYSPLVDLVTHDHYFHTWFIWTILPVDSFAPRCHWMPTVTTPDTHTHVPLHATRSTRSYTVTHTTPLHTFYTQLPWTTFGPYSS